MVWVNFCTYTLVTILRFLFEWCCKTGLCNSCSCECPYHLKSSLFFILSKCLNKTWYHFAVYRNNMSQTKAHISINYEEYNVNNHRNNNKEDINYTVIEMSSQRILFCIFLAVSWA